MGLEIVINSTEDMCRLMCDNEIPKISNRKNTEEIIIDFINNTIEYAQQCTEELGETAQETVKADYAVEILLQLADDLGIMVQI